jgi:hypothetical protein
MKIVNKDGQNVTIINQSARIANAQAALDLMASAHYHDSNDAMVIYKESFDESFFDLKTGFAGEVLQKFSNYHMRLAIVGDFSVYKSNALRDFIYECNKGNHILFKTSLEEALNALAAKQ